MPPAPDDRGDRLAGTLLGTALGDALGLPAEGMSARAIGRRFGTIDRFRLLGTTGFVSDDTEQAALVAESLIRSPSDPTACAEAFRRSLLAWFARLPFGVGRATIRACLRIAMGRLRSGVRSAGNGAAMRAAIVGVFFADDPTARASFGRSLAETTHVDARAIEGALFVADLAAACTQDRGERSATALFECARSSVTHPELTAALDLARALADDPAVSAHDAARACGTSGFVVHTVAFASFAFLRSGPNIVTAFTETIGAGGDTDSIAAILGSWIGARRGASSLPQELIGRLHDGPFGPTHLRALAEALDRVRRGEPATVPRYSRTGALARNLGLLPVILWHGFRRLVPF